ncbi:MAG: hypothetical protein NC089_03255 [Bacteroides sp.]|nr:hypothetical protein [Bacteroides sp.]MCM1549951.1 hypothetical protein [Clostridium sp.]
MKEIWRYKYYSKVIETFALLIIFIFMSKEWKVLKIVLFVSIALFLVFLILFLNEYYNSIQIKKNGMFVLGTMNKESFTYRYVPKSFYFLKACVKYYDEERKMTLRFQGYDFITTSTMRLERLKEMLNTDEEVEVLVGYLPEEPKICELYLKDAFEKI